MKKFIKKHKELGNLTFLNTYYFIVGHVRWFIHGRAIKQYVKKAMACEDCFAVGECKKCECEFNPLALTNKCK